MNAMTLLTFAFVLWRIHFKWAWKLEKRGGFSEENFLKRSRIILAFHYVVLQ